MTIAVKLPGVIDGMRWLDKRSTDGPSHILHTYNKFAGIKRRTIQEMRSRLCLTRLPVKPGLRRTYGEVIW